MSEALRVTLAKISALSGFCILLATTYYLRHEVLALSHIRFSSDENRARYDLEQMKESYPERIQEHEIAVANYDLQMEHYRQMLELYRTNYEEYAKRLKDEYQPPQLPSTPVKPRPPEFQQKLYEANAEFRQRKSDYFETTASLTWTSGVAALALAGGLLYLALFDSNGKPLYYLAALLMSFVFLIGPSMHSLLTSVIGFLEAPGVY